MSGMFTNCSSLTTLDVSGFDTSNVTNMATVFTNCSSLTTLDVSGFKTGSATSMSGMFSGCAKLTSLDVSGFDTGNVTNMASVFTNCSSLTSLDVSGFKTGSVTNTSGIFSGCSKLTSLDVSGFDTGNVIAMNYMFANCSSLISLDTSNFDMSKVTNMAYMFSGCSKLTSLDVSGFQTGNVTNMEYMFYRCSSLTTLDVSGFKTGSATNMSGMFSGCSKLISLDVSGFNTGNVTNMGYMFYECSSLTVLDLSSFNTTKVTSATYMFSGTSLHLLKSPSTTGSNTIALPATFYKVTDNEITDTSVTAIPANLTSSVTYAASPSGTVHTWETRTVKAATCTETGLTASTCTVCGVTKEPQTIPMTGHTASGVTTANKTDATWQLPATWDETVTCTVCGETLSSTHVTDYHSRLDAIIGKVDTEISNHTIGLWNYGTSAWQTLTESLAAAKEVADDAADEDVNTSYDALYAAYVNTRVVESTYSIAVPAEAALEQGSTDENGTSYRKDVQVITSFLLDSADKYVYCSMTAPDGLSDGSGSTAELTLSGTSLTWKMSDTDVTYADEKYHGSGSLGISTVLKADGFYTGEIVFTFGVGTDAEELTPAA
jgi:surface protein